MTAYAVVSVAEPERHIVVFDSGALAGNDARKRNDDARQQGVNARYRVVRVETESVPDWHAREIARLLSGEYKPLPWHHEAWKIGEHFAHVSKDDNSKVAFTPDNTHGEQDRQMRMRPGRYLERYYGDKLSADDIRRWCAVFSTENEGTELHFADDADEIERVYTSGPNSCMSHDASDYESPFHPTRVYAAGDLAIAYIERDDSVTARALCWPERRVYGRIYGDEDRLGQLLEAAGYSRGYNASDWNGARLIAHECDDGFVAPYLDNPNWYVSLRGKHLIIDNHGDIECRETNGLAESGGYVCDHCGERCRETHTVDGESWCSDCESEDAFYCDGCFATTAGSPYLETHNGRSICESCADDYTRCNGCDEYYYSDDVEQAVDGECYCGDCARTMVHTHCGQLADNEDDCDCNECERERERRDPDCFELEASTETPAREVARPVHLKPTSTTINDPRQFVLVLDPVLNSSLNNDIETMPLYLLERLVYQF